MQPSGRCGEEATLVDAEAPARECVLFDKIPSKIYTVISPVFPYTKRFRNVRKPSKCQIARWKRLRMIMLLMKHTKLEVSILT